MDLWICGCGDARKTDWHELPKLASGEAISIVVYQYPLLENKGQHGTAGQGQQGIAKFALLQILPPKRDRQ